MSESNAEQVASDSSETRSLGTSFHTARPGTSRTATTTIVIRPKLMRAGTVRTNGGSTVTVGCSRAMAVRSNPPAVSAIDGLVMPQPLDVRRTAASRLTPLASWASSNSRLTDVTPAMVVYQLEREPMAATIIPYVHWILLGLGVVAWAVGLV